jgi:prophage antirepressor-like protein
MGLAETHPIGNNSKTLKIMTSALAYKNHLVRNVGTEDYMLIPLQDVADCLALLDLESLADNIDPDRIKMAKVEDSMGRIQLARCLTEGGFYQAVFRCQTSNAAATELAKWVLDVMMPTVKRTGGYNHPLTFKQALGMFELSVEAGMAGAAQQCVKLIQQMHTHMESAKISPGDTIDMGKTLIITEPRSVDLDVVWKVVSAMLDSGGINLNHFRVVNDFIFVQPEDFSSILAKDPALNGVTRAELKRALMNGEELKIPSKQRFFVGSRYRWKRADPVTCWGIRISERMKEVAEKMKELTRQCLEENQADL